MANVEKTGTTQACVEEHDSPLTVSVRSAFGQSWSGEKPLRGKNDGQLGKRQDQWVRRAGEIRAGITERAPSG